jgi:predicted amidohydrolase
MHKETKRASTGDRIRICSAQVAPVWEDPAATLVKAEAWTRYAASSGADLICFPEQFATGWDPASGKNVQEINGTIVSAIRRFAKENSIAILGSFRKATSAGPENTAVAIGKTCEVLCSYSKMHLFSPGHEDRFFIPGHDPGLFTIGPLSCGIAICYDLRFPELFRLYAMHGVQAIFVPSAWPAERIAHWELFIRARAAENQMYVIGINTTGTTPVAAYAGGSMTADPHGVIVQRAGGAEQVIFTDIDCNAVQEARRAFPVLCDRRDELYRSLQKKGQGS